MIEENGSQDIQPYSKKGDIQRGERETERERRDRKSGIKREGEGELQLL